MGEEAVGEAHGSSPCNTEVKNAWGCTSTGLYIS